MSNRIVKALEHGAEKLGKTLAKDASKAVQDLYHDAGGRLKKVATNHAENDAKHAAELDKLLKGNKHDMPRAPHATSGAGRPRGGGTSRGARNEAESGHPNDKTRRDESKCTDGTDPVDLASGKVFLSQTDITLPGALPLAFTRKYESSTRIGHHIGRSWSSTIDQHLEIDDKGVVFVTETGMLLRYTLPETGERVLPTDGPRWPLMRTIQGDWAVHDPQTGQTRYFSDALHAPGIALPDEITDRNGHRITFDYADETGIPYAIRHSAGYELKLTCDEKGRLDALHLVGAAEDGSDQLIRSYGHDDDGNLTTVTNSAGAVTRFEYDTEHRMTAWVDSNESRYEYTYDHRHRCISQSGAEGHLANRFSYGEPDPETGERTTVHTNGQGASTRYRINERLQVIAVTDPLGNTSRTTYNTDDRPVQTTDPLGATTHLAYDEGGRLIAVVRPDGTTNTATYTDLGLPTEVTGPDGQTVHQEYDAKGNRTALTDAAGRTTRFTYDGRGHLTSVTDPLGSVTRIECDEAGLPLTVTDPLGATTTFHRDAFGRATSVTDPLGHTTHYQWAPEGHLVARLNPDSTQEAWTYDGEGNCTTHTDSLGQVTTFEYGHFDKLKTRTDPDGARHEFLHDAELQLVQVTNPQGLTWSYEYDPAGRLVSETDFDNRTQTYTHDQAGRLTSRTTPLGHTIRLQYDALGRTLTKDVDGEITTFTYDAAGRPLQANSPGSELIWTRDEHGQVVAETSNGRTTTFSYDVLGRRISRTTPTGAVSRWSYDAAGRRTGLDTSGHALAFAHDALGRELSRTLGDITFAHTYDALGRLTDQHVTSAAETIQHRAYTYRADGYLTGIDDHLNGARHFELDPTGRVTTVSAHNWTETYAYDAAGNQTHATWPDRHAAPEARGERAYTGTRVNVAGGFRYEYDAAGRTTLRQKTRLSRKPDTWHYSWDAEDRLVACTTPDGTCWRYTYDALGRRTTKQRLAEDGEHVAEQVAFTWDGTTLCEETTIIHGRATQATLTWDHQGLRPLAQTERIMATDASQEVIDSRFFAIITDLVGTPTELVSENGEIAWRTRNTLWGSTTWNRQATAHTPLRFPGQYFDVETGLHFNYFRHYDPETGRYLSPDPLGLEPSPNPAAYVPNPHSIADPLGLSPYAQDGKKEDGNFVYRNLRPDEDPRHGLDAKNPNATYKPAGHVIHGSKPNWKSQFISTTRSEEVALGEQWTTGRVVKIDLDKHPGGIHDLSTPEGRTANDIRGVTAVNRTKASQEVLLTGHVPTEAISWVVGGP
ncbi:DUF6531 domain-containing protein [Streptomyces sp. CT34]|uniref:DUF6531 domain-containing protein n=1 Tax=Streptomyces sp. CT34 TaxID=1553907 RepID=UPI00099B75EB|nr:DUF6531 domain-containing protein [Streptomyces sp. CT34]